MRRNSGIIGAKQTPDTALAPGVFDTFDVYNARKNNNWPIVAPSATITLSGTVFNEGQSIIFTVNTSGIDIGNTINWDLELVSGNALTPTDFSATSGSFTVDALYSFPITLTISQDSFTEGTETFRVNARYLGSLLATSPTFTVNDTSTGTPEPTELYTFTTVTFGAGTTANIGPSLAQVQSAMTGTPTPSFWNTSADNLVVNTGIILWTVPATATYRITAEGASGQAPSATNRGASIRGDFALTKGQKLRIVVGQVPVGTAGGGGSYVVKETGSTNSDIFVIAGGGGGKSGGTGGTATVANSTNTVSNGNGGIGTSQSWGGPAGGGFFTSGTVNTGSQPGGSPGAGFLQGSAGGSGGAGNGGFGGGGAGGADSAAGGGAGGGYSGGSSGGDGSNGQGAGSYPNGANQVNTANSRSGAGQVTITRL
jgi:hypothetical protein